jgi:hypothetical protein
MFGKVMNVVDTLRQLVIDVGFENVKEDIYKVCSIIEIAKYKRALPNHHCAQIPIAGWPREKRFKELGQVQQLCLVDSVEAYSLALFTRVLGWKLPELQVFLAQVRAEIKNPNNHLWCRTHFIYGRKPAS